MRRIHTWVAATVAMMGAQAATAQSASSQSCAYVPYIVYFNADSATITPEGVAVLQNVADSYRYCSGVNLTISGHTDRKGADNYNVGLSQRMAANVRDFLIAQGIPESMMMTQAFGESRPMIDTADGVKEAQNRRVEITFGPGSGW